MQRQVALGGWEEMHSQAVAADDVTASASTLISPEGFIFNENMSGCDLSQVADVCVCVCVMAVILHLKCVYVCVCLSGFPATSHHVNVFTYRMCDPRPLAPLCARQRAEIARGEVERLCVSCRRTPLCLHVDLLDLQLTNLSAGLIFLPKGST